MTFRLLFFSRAAAVVLLAIVVGAGSPLDVSAQTSDTTRVSFDDAVRIALEQNTDLKRAANRVDAADATIWAERMDFVPDLNVSTRFSRSFGRSFSQEEGEVINQSTDFLRGDLSTNLTVFDGFANFASLSSAKAEGVASELTFQRRQQDVVFRVMNQYISLVENREILRVQREELEARRQQLEQIQEFVDAGSRPISALYEQQAAVAEQESSVLTAERDIQLSETRLIQVLQLDPLQSYDFEAPSIPQDSLVGGDVYDLDALLQEALDRRLDLKASRSQLRATRQEVRVARSGYYPSISLFGSYGTDWSSRIGDTQLIVNERQDVSLLTAEGPTVPTRIVTDADEVPINFFDKLDNRRGGNFGVRLSFPIFDGLRRDQRIEQAKVREQDAEYALQDQRLQISLQVREAYLNYQNAVKQLDATSKRLRAARQAREAAQERYNLGAASIVELTNANRTFVEAASGRIRARYTFVFQQKLIDYFVGTLNPETELFR